MAKYLCGEKNSQSPSKLLVPVIIFPLLNLHSLYCSFPVFTAGAGALLLGVVSAVVYSFFQVKMTEEQEFDKFWYYYPSNEVIAAFAFVQFVSLLLLVAAPRQFMFEFCLVLELTFVPTYLLHFYLCYHKVNPFLPIRCSAMITHLNVYRFWKVAVIYIVPVGLLLALYFGFISRGILIGFYIAPTTFITGLMAYLMVSAVMKNGGIVWKLPILSPSTYLMQQKKCYLVYISVNLFNGDYKIEHDKPGLSLWRKIVYFRLFESENDAFAYSKMLSKLNDSDLEKLICQQNPTKESRTEWIVKN